MSSVNAITVSACVAVGALGVAASARAAFLEWSRFDVKTSSERVCMRFAADVARQKNLQNIRIIPIEVAGVRGSVYVSITCIGRSNQPAVAMVITASDDNNAATSTRNDIAAALKGMTCFDACN